MLRLKDKKVVITGAAKGIGKAIALKFAKEGASIAFTYLSSKIEAKKLEKTLQALNIKAKGYLINASSLKETDTFFQQVLNEFGTVDILVNNAGITQDNFILRMSEDEWDKVIHTNLKSVYNTTHIFSKHFIQKRSGNIINISSIIGIKGNAAQANYAASKAGIIGFTKSIALELGNRNIRANVVAPGFITTDMTKRLKEDIIQKISNQIPLKRTGRVDEVADCALFLASQESSYITGQVIQVDGGLLT